MQLVNKKHAVPAVQCTSMGLHLYLLNRNKGRIQTEKVCRVLNLAFEAVRLRPTMCCWLWGVEDDGMRMGEVIVAMYNIVYNMAQFKVQAVICAEEHGRIQDE